MCLLISFRISRQIWNFKEVDSGWIVVFSQAHLISLKKTAPHLLMIQWLLYSFEPEVWPKKKKSVFFRIWEMSDKKALKLNPWHFHMIIVNWKQLQNSVPIMSAEFKSLAGLFPFQLCCCWNCWKAKCVWDIVIYFFNYIV